MNKGRGGILGLSELLDRYPRQLSGGQRQRVAMGRAIVRDPQVFLFDEPLSNLDAKLRVAMRTELKELHQRLKTTSVYVTHDQIEAMTMADQIVVMRDGLVEQRGKPLDLYDHPANVFVAGFIGSPAMNFLPRRGPARGAAARVELAVGAAVPTRRRRPTAAVVYGIAPSTSRSAPGERVARRPSSWSSRRASTRRSSRCWGHEVTAVFRERHDFSRPATACTSRRTRRTHLFDAATGSRLAA